MLLDVMPAVAVEEVGTPQGLEALRPEWAALWNRCPGATPFQAPAWLLPWWRHLGGGSLWVLTLRHDGRLAGLLPLFCCRTPDDAARQVYLIGTGITDRLNVLLEPEMAHSGMEALLTYLVANHDRWDECDFQQIPEGSPLLRATLPEEYRPETGVQDACPVLSLPGTVEEFTRSLSPRQRWNLQYCRRRAERMGPVRVDRAETGNLEELLTALLRLHQTRWAAVNRLGVLGDAAIQRFHCEAAAEFLRAGMLRLYLLRIGGRSVASFYGFADRRRAYYYLGGFDPEFRQLSPGTLIVDHAIREAIREGLEAFDFLRGREAYKYRWGARDSFNYRRRLVPRSGEGS